MAYFKWGSWNIWWRSTKEVALLFHSNLSHRRGCCTTQLLLATVSRRIVFQLCRGPMLVNRKKLSWLKRMHFDYPWVIGKRLVFPWVSSWVEHGWRNPWRTHDCNWQNQINLLAGLRFGEFLWPNLSRVEHHSFGSDRCSQTFGHWFQNIICCRFALESNNYNANLNFFQSSNVVVDVFGNEDDVVNVGRDHTFCSLSTWY